MFLMFLNDTHELPTVITYAEVDRKRVSSRKVTHFIYLFYYWAAFITCIFFLKSKKLKQKKRAFNYNDSYPNNALEVKISVLRTILHKNISVLCLPSSQMTDFSEEFLIISSL